MLAMLLGYFVSLHPKLSPISKCVEPLVLIRLCKGRPKEYTMKCKNIKKPTPSLPGNWSMSAYILRLAFAREGACWQKGRKKSSSDKTFFMIFPVVGGTKEGDRIGRRWHRYRRTILWVSETWLILRNMFNYSMQWTTHNYRRCWGSIQWDVCHSCWLVCVLDQLS